jgi:hypothetical protein
MFKAETSLFRQHKQKIEQSGAVFVFLSAAFVRLFLTTLHAISVANGIMQH